PPHSQCFGGPRTERMALKLCLSMDERHERHEQSTGRRGKDLWAVIFFAGSAVHRLSRWCPANAGAVPGARGEDIIDKPGEQAMSVVPGLDPPKLAGRRTVGLLAYTLWRPEHVIKVKIADRRLLLVAFAAAAVSS